MILAKQPNQRLEARHFRASHICKIPLHQIRKAPFPLMCQCALGLSNRLDIDQQVIVYRGEFVQLLFFNEKGLIIRTKKGFRYWIFQGEKECLCPI